MDQRTREKEERKKVKETVEGGLIIERTQN